MDTLLSVPRILLLIFAVALLMEIALFALEPFPVAYGIRLLVAFLLMYLVLRRIRIATLLLTVIAFVLGSWELYLAIGREWLSVWVQLWLALRGIFFLFMAWYLAFSPAVRAFLAKSSKLQTDAALTRAVATLVSGGGLLLTVVITVASIWELPFLYADSAVFWSVASDPESPDSVRATDDGIKVIDGLYAISNDKLYLLHHRVVAHSLRRTKFRTRFYDTEWIAQFRQAHPELERYWPDASSPHGGMKWNRLKKPQ